MTSSSLVYTRKGRREEREREGEREGRRESRRESERVRDGVCMGLTTKLLFEIVRTSPRVLKTRLQKR